MKRTLATIEPEKLLKAMQKKYIRNDKLLKITSRVVLCSHFYTFHDYTKNKNMKREI